MDILNLIISFPGKVSAAVISQQLDLIALLLFAPGLFLIQYGLILQNRNFSAAGLILIGVLMSFFPFLIGHGTFHSPVFWAGISLGLLTGALFYIFFGDRLGESFESNRGKAVQDLPQKVGETGGFSLKERKYILILLVLLSFLALYFRTFQIEQYPTGYSFWELDNSYDVVKYDRGDLKGSDFKKLWGIKEVGLASHSPILMGMSYLFFKIFGISLSTGRYFSVFLGVSGLIFLFLYLRTQFSLKATVFLVTFVALGLTNITFSRTGLQNITAFSYGAFVLFLMEVLIKPRKPLTAFFCGIAFGAVLFGSLYMYLAARVIIFSAVLILFVKAVFIKHFFRKHLIPLVSSGLTLAIILYVYINGKFVDLWPKYASYIHPEKNTSYFSFIGTALGKLRENLLPTIDRIVFNLRSIDSLSVYSEGGLVVEPVLCLVPFALGYLAVGAVKRVRYLSLVVILGSTLLPAMLSGVPNARRLLLFLSFFLILPGITFFLQHDLIQEILRSGRKKLAYLISGALILGVFSHNLHIFLDIYGNMKKNTSVAMPFAESGFMDIRYSRFLKGLAKKINAGIKDHDVFYYYSQIYDENATAPNGAPEQFVIETHENARNGGRLVWMNQLYEGYQPFRNPNRSHYFGFEEAVKMVQSSSRNVKIFFIKPLADERALFNRLKLYYPQGKGEEILEEGKGNTYLVLTITRDQIKEASGLGPDLDLKPFEGEFTDNKIHNLIQKNLREDLPWKENFLVNEDSEIIFKHYSSEMLDVFLDGRKLDDNMEKIVLFKGIHELEVRSTLNKPFTLVKVSPSGAEDLKGTVFLPPPDLSFMENTKMKNFDLRWKVKKKEKFQNKITPHSIFIRPNGSFWYSDYGQIRDPMMTPKLEGEFRTITKIKEKNNKIYILRTHILNNGWFTLYDLEFNRLKDLVIKPYPLDLFFDNEGKAYITHLQDKEILVYSPNDSFKIWNTSDLSDYPIWNGAVDEKGDFILLSAAGEVLILDPDKNLRTRFFADTTWKTFHAAIRDPAGLVISKGIIHILDAQNNVVKSYRKTGERLFNSGETTVVEVPPEFKIDFIQEKNGRLILISRSLGGHYVELEAEKYVPGKPGFTKMILTDLEPESVKVGWGTLQKNEKGSLSQKIGGEKVEKFLFAHAPSRLTYLLKGNFNNFSFGFGLDDINQNDAGSVRFIVKGDGRVLFNSPVVRPMSRIQKQVIDVSGVAKLELIVETTEDGNANDEAVWVEPTLNY